MPYTPPTAGSPSASYHNSPPRSPSTRPNLPRSNSSTSYLSRHRRSPSWQGHHSDKSSYFPSHNDVTHLSVRQSPPPVTDSAIPTGAIISPPDSTQNSSDDDESPRNDSHQVKNWQELQEAVRTIPVNRVPTSPPNGHHESSRPRYLNLDLLRSNSDSDLSSSEPPPRLSPSARKISHSRSATEGSILDKRTTKSAGASPAGSDESDEDTDSSGQDKPPLLRKKSGELVKPAIRPSSRRKHSSMPGTPTFAKAVHFNDDIEQVRHFLQVDRPIAVSAGTSPVDGYEDETEFPFGHQSKGQYEWDIRLSNFPRESFERLSHAVRVERISLSLDHKYLIGVVAVANLAFHKTVAARFTLDYWKTTSEVLAEFNNDVRQKPRNDGYDQFNFSIKLSDLANLESKTLFICVRYHVNGQDFWDNNSSQNYQVDFVRKEKKDDEQKFTQQVSATRPIPRSKQSSSPNSRSVQSYDDDFSARIDANTALKLRSSPSSKADLSDAPLQKRQPPHGHQFGSRYDFGASLSAALVQAQAKMSTTDNKPKREPSSEKPRIARDSLKLPGIPTSRAAELSRTGYVPPANSTVESPRPDALLATNQTFDSRAYQDFVSKFCFFGSSKPGNNTQALGRQQHHGSTDGAQDDANSSPDFGTEDGELTNLNGSQVSSEQRQSSSSSPSPSPLPASGTGTNPRAPSPVSFGYPYTAESRSGGFTPESYTPPTAIQG